MRSLHAVSGLVMVLAMAGCSDNKPARIVSGAPSSPILDSKPFSLQAAAVNKAGTRLEGEKLSYSANPADVVSISPTGECHCLKSGDATVLVAGGGQSALVGVKCRLVLGVNAPREARFEVGKEGTSFHAAAVGADNSSFSDVTVALASSDDQVLRVAGQTITPMAVGRATLRSSAGPYSTTTEALVVQTIESAPLLLNDGSRQSWTLPAGNYEIDIQVAPNLKVSDGVTVTWLGSDCSNQAERQVHHIRGHVADTSALTIENPSVFGIGAAMNGFVKITRVP